MTKLKMEMYYNANPQFKVDIRSYIQNIIDERKDIKSIWEFFEYDGKYFDVNIFKDKDLIKAYVYWTSFKFYNKADLYVTQKNDVMPLGYFQVKDKGEDDVA
tara:strand:+ start:632 stop:937 length:306 start_codon:yes stop_codon:yes gene_type:complete